MSTQTQQIWEKQNQIQMELPSPEPKLTVRSKTQIVSEGILRYMGETFQLPERFALGLVGEGEAEQVIEEQRPLNWMQSAPGPFEGDRGDKAKQGSRESGDPDQAAPGDQQQRQKQGAQFATEHQPQQDVTRQQGEPGGSGPFQSGTPAPHQRFSRR
jgi:hypothetical protein